jgi:hypothetical protein
MIPDAAGDTGGQGRRGYRWRLTGLTGKDEIIWLRGCLSACTLPSGRLKGAHVDRRRPEG